MKGKTSFLKQICQIAVVVPICLALFLAACDSSPSPSSDEKETAQEKKSPLPSVGLFLYKKDPYIAMVSDNLHRELGGKVALTEYDAGNNQVAQHAQIDAAIANKTELLLVNLVNVQAGANIADKAKKAGIPVIFFNREPDLESIKRYKKAAFVGTNAQEAGKLQGDIIKEIWTAHPEYDRNKDGVVQYIMLQGPVDSAEAIDRTEYSVKSAVEKGVKMEQVGETYTCDWDEKLALEAVRLALVMHGGNIEFIIANNDAMALGAIKALQAHGFNKENGRPDQFIPVIGVDAIAEAVDAIHKGTMSATVKQDGAAMASAIAALALNALQGKDFIDGTAYTWDKSGVAVRIPYAVTFE